MTREPILTSSALFFLCLGGLSVAPLFVGVLQLIAAWRSPASERLGPLAEVTAWVREFLVLWGVGSLWPLQMVRRTWTRHAGSPDLVPVVLVPGYLESETLMGPLQGALKKDGRSFDTYKYQPILGPGDAQAHRLAAFIKDTRERAGTEQVDVIGHSYGGLLLRRVAQKAEAHGIRRLVLLATPHRGSRIAAFAVGAAGRDLRPDSSFLKELGPEAPPCATLDLRTSCDAMIHPRDSAALGGHSERLRGAWGHNSMLIASETIRRTLSFLA